MHINVVCVSLQYSVHKINVCAGCVKKNLHCSLIHVKYLYHSSILIYTFHIVSDQLCAMYSVKLSGQLHTCTCRVVTTVYGYSYIFVSGVAKGQSLLIDRLLSVAPVCERCSVLLYTYSLC